MRRSSRLLKEDCEMKESGKLDGTVSASSARSITRKPRSRLRKAVSEMEGDQKIDEEDNVLILEKASKRNPAVAKKGGAMDTDMTGALSDDENWMMFGDSPPRNDFRKTSTVGRRWQGKLIMLDDLLQDAEKRQKEKLKWEQEKKKWEAISQEDSEDLDDDINVEQVDVKATVAEKLLVEYEKEVTAVEEVVIPKWGEEVFGFMKPYPNYVIPEDSTGVIQRALEFNAGQLKGEFFLEELLSSNGLLRAWIICEGQCDEVTLRWLFYQMVFSQDERVQNAACVLLQDLILSKRRGGEYLCTLQWVPSLVNIMEVFHIYGFVNIPGDLSISCTTDMDTSGLSFLFSMQGNINQFKHGPPSNLRCLLEFLVASSPARARLMLSAFDLENLLVVVAQLQLDRRLLGISAVIHQCLRGLIDSFTDDEWSSACNGIATSLARISSKPVNSMRIAKGLHGMSSRICALQTIVVFDLLSKRGNTESQITSTGDIVRIFESINIKAQNQNFVELYDLLILADLGLWSDRAFKIDEASFVSWKTFLRRCCTKIFSSDERPYATKVRNLASFLWQKYHFEQS